MEEYDVILAEAGNKVGRLVKRSLEQLGLHVLICDRREGDVLTLPASDSLNYALQIKSIAESCGAGMVIPIFYPEALAAHRELLGGIILPVDDAATLHTLDDKLCACALAESLGILQPHMYTSVDEVDHYPVVFKRTGGHGGDSAYFPKLRSSLEHLVAASVPGTYLISDEIDGYDASVDVLRWDGQFCASAYRVLLPKAKGVSIMRRSIDAPELVETARRILEAVDFRGVCGVDFRVERGSGKAYFLECNPRFSGGLASAMASGFDIPKYLWMLASGQQVRLPEKPRTGVRTADIADLRGYLRRRISKRRLNADDILLALSLPFCKKY